MQLCFSALLQCDAKFCRLKTSSLMGKCCGALLVLTATVRSLLMAWRCCRSESAKRSSNLKGLQESNLPCAERRPGFFFVFAGVSTSNHVVSPRCVVRVVRVVLCGSGLVSSGLRHRLMQRMQWCLLESGPARLAHACLDGSSNAVVPSI